jgi:hypothetical protein
MYRAALGLIHVLATAILVLLAGQLRDACLRERRLRDGRACGLSAALRWLPAADGVDFHGVAPGAQNSSRVRGKENACGPE